MTHDQRGDPAFADHALPSLEPGAGSPGGWLVLADPEGSIDLQRLFPEVRAAMAPDSASFASMLDAHEPGLVVLLSPPADPADVQRAAAWLRMHLRSRAVLLSDHQTVALRLQALELGFDDAIDLSADPMEVVGRLSIAGRRAGGFSPQKRERIPVAEGVELDRRARALRRDGRLVSLRPKEYSLLEFMALHSGRPFTRDELLRHVWHDSDGNERTIDVYVFWLRSKIERDPTSPRHLLTVRGSGYLLDTPEHGALARAPLAAEPANVNEAPMPR
jgi:DNA-binding response OmpR family regulator